MLRMQWHLTQTELADRVGMHGTDITRIESGKRRVPSSDRERIAAVFGITGDQLLSMAVNPRIPQQVQGVPPGRIPVINRVQAGPGGEAYEWGTTSGEAPRYVDSDGINDPLAFGFEVVGDSMEPKYSEGDVVICSPFSRSDGAGAGTGSLSLVPGQHVFVRFTHESSQRGSQTIAVWQPVDDEPDGPVVLGKTNPSHGPIVCRRSEIEQLAIVLEIRHRPSPRPRASISPSGDRRPFPRR